MTLEGRIRELGLHEVCQLVGLSRKTGVLEIRAPLQGAAASISFVHGAIVGASVWSLAASRTLEPRRSDVTPEDTRIIEARVLDVLAWSDGEFQFVGADPAALHTGVRISIEPLLVEAAQRAEVWERVADRIPNARAVPAFVDLEAEGLPLLRLAPHEWEILTRVDGRRDLVELAHVLRRDLVDIALLVHGLIGYGLLKLRDGAQTRRRHATPPSSPVIGQAFAGDLWIPGDDPDVVFDPVRIGISTPDGLPRLRTPLASSTVSGAGSESVTASPSSSRLPTPPFGHDDPILGPRFVDATPVTQPRRETVASHDRATSCQREAVAPSVALDAPARLCERGDDAARRGDLVAAMECWKAALRPNALASDVVDAHRVREAIALAARLHALLHPSSRDAPSN